jgi:hypothetical protein
MATGEGRIKSLYAGLYRTIVRLGLLITAAWVFAAFSFYLSRKTGIDWFTRSGAVMALVGAAVTFRLANFYQGAPPGFGHQHFLHTVLPKITRARQMIDRIIPVSCDLEVDGAVDATTAPLAVAAGVDVLVAGSALFNDSESVTAAMERLRTALRP